MSFLKSLLALSICALVACDKPAANKPAASKQTTVKQTADAKGAKKTITFATMRGFNTYYVNGEDKVAGLEYELASLFAEELGADYQVKFLVQDDFASVLAAIKNNKADIAASDITVTPDRKNLFNFSAPYQTVRQQVVYNRDVTPPPRKFAAIMGKNIVVPTDTSYVERLQTLSKEHSGLAWETKENTNTEQLIEAVSTGEIEFTIADNHLLSVMQYYYPNVGMGFSISKDDNIAWALPKNGDAALLAKANKFFAKIKANGTLNNLLDRYHGNTQRLNPYDVRSFMASSKTLLPKYKQLFKNAQEVTQIDWRLLAALSYQESHWDTFNTSPTNVRGLMMLTEDTSDLMKVSDRLDPKQSVPAGAKFFLWLKERFPDRMEEPDRTFMALASYNIGFGHVEDARVLAQRLNLNPDSWVDIKKTLLLLKEPKYYSKAKHGFCACAAPIIYTEYIRSYYSILQQQEPAHYINQDDPFRIASN